MYISVCMYVYIYIYIYRERERDIFPRLPSASKRLDLARWAGPPQEV